MIDYYEQVQLADTASSQRYSINGKRTFILAEGSVSYSGDGLIAFPPGIFASDGTYGGTMYIVICGRQNKVGM